MTAGYDMGFRPRRTLAIVIPLAVAGAVLVGAFGPRGTHHHGAATPRRTSPVAQRVRRSRSPTGREATTTTTAVESGPPYAVGVTQVSLSRTDATGFRPLPVSVRYPAVGSAAGAETGDAPAAPGRFSLVLFAHGWNGSADFYASMDREIASAGFIVAAPSFPHTSSVSGPMNRGDVVNQPADLAFLIDQFTGTPPELLDGHVAPTKVGVVGHSDGGVTAAGIAFNTCCVDPRVGAAAVLSGAELFFGGAWFPPASPPLLAVHGASDEVNPFGASQRLFDDAPSPKFLVRAPGGHIPPFTTDPVVRPAVSTLVADFLLAELDGDAQARQRVPTDADAGGLQLVGSG
jgi:dienelactone hydrolase